MNCKPSNNCDFTGYIPDACGCSCSPAECYTKGYNAGLEEGKQQGFVAGLSEGARRERDRICSLIGCDDHGHKRCCP